MKSLILLTFGIICATLFFNSVNAAAVEDKNETKTEASTVKSELTIHEDCHQPLQTGRCFALFYRYGYNVEKGDCVEFIYGGCAGNSNNFQTIEECQSKCIDGKGTTEIVVENATAVSTSTEKPKE